MRPASIVDLDRICDLLWHPDVRRYLCDDLVLPRATIAGFLERSDALDARRLGLWCIHERAGHFIGIGGLKPVDTETATAPEMADSIEVTIALHPDAWHRGYARACVEALARYAHERCGLQRLVAIVDEPNAASRRLMGRCGFVEIGGGPGPANRLVFYQRRLDAQANAVARH